MSTKRLISALIYRFRGLNILNANMVSKVQISLCRLTGLMIWELLCICPCIAGAHARTQVHLYFQNKPDKPPNDQTNSELRTHAHTHTHVSKLLTRIVWAQPISKSICSKWTRLWIECGFWCEPTPLSTAQSAHLPNEHTGQRCTRSKCSLKHVHLVA